MSYFVYNIISFPDESCYGLCPLSHGATLGAIQVGLSMNIGREESDTEEVIT